MNIGELVATIGGDNRDLKRALDDSERSIERSSQKMQGDVERLNATLERTGRNMQRIGRNMSMYVTAPIVAFGALALRTAGNFEASMNRVAAISQATGDQLQHLERQARELGSTTQFSASEAADAMSFLAMAGFEVNQIMTAMPSVLNLAAAAQLDMASSADIVSNIMQGFGMQAGEVENAVDVLAASFTRSNTDLVQLGQAMKLVGPVASSFGIQFEETAAAVGFLSDAGLQASMAGTGLRRILSTLAKDAEKLGIQTFDSAGKMRPLADMLEDLEKMGLSAAESMEIFGQRGGPALQVLLSRGGDALRQMTGELQDVGGTAQRIAEQQMEGLNGSLKELRSAFEELQLAIAKSGLLDFATNLAKKLTDFTRTLSSLNPETLRFATGLAGIAAAIGPILIALGFFTKTILPALITGLTTLRTAALGPLGIALMVVYGAFKLLNNEIRRNKAYIDDLAEASLDALINEEERLTATLEAQNRAFEMGPLSDLRGRELEEWQRLARENIAATESQLRLVREQIQLTQEATDETKKAHNELVNMFSDIDLMGGIAKERIDDLKIPSAVFESWDNFSERIQEYIGNIDKAEARSRELQMTVKEMAQLATEELEDLSWIIDRQADQWKSWGIVAGGAIAGVANELGHFISGAQSGFQSLMSSVINSIQTIINMLFAKAAAGLFSSEVSSKGVIGLATAAVGVGVLKGLWSKHVKASNAPPALAQGGILTGPSLVLGGEYPGVRTNPEVVMPLDKLKTMLGTGGRPGNILAEVRFDRGDLVFMVKEGEDYFNKTF